jgi:hypothetical protein
VIPMAIPNTMPARPFETLVRNSHLIMIVSFETQNFRAGRGRADVRLVK